MAHPRFTTARTWPILLGITATVLVTAVIAAYGTGRALDGVVPPDHISAHESMQRGLRIAFLLIAVGAACQLPPRLPARWRWSVAAALAVLACAVVGEIAVGLARQGWILDVASRLGAKDSFERRVFRLGAMAAYAVPMLVLLAAGEEKRRSAPESGHMSARIAELLTRFEAPLFAVGASLLASALMAAAFIHEAFTWLAGAGADAAFVACLAAAARARQRADRLAFGGWLLVCTGMAVGLLMGLYSFGGPVPAPAIIGDYDALPRLLLRDGHVVLLNVGIAGIAAAAVCRDRKGAT